MNWILHLVMSNRSKTSSTSEIALAEQGRSYPKSEVEWKKKAVMILCLRAYL